MVNPQAPKVKNPYTGWKTLAIFAAGGPHGNQYTKHLHQNTLYEKAMSLLFIYNCLPNM